MEVVLAALVTAFAAVLVAIVGRGLLDARFKRTIGQANGRGTIVQMNEEQLDMLERMEASVVNVEQHRVTAERRLQELAASVSAINFNMQQLTRFQNLINGVRLDFEARFEDIVRQLDDIDKRLQYVEQTPPQQRFRIPSIPSRTIERDVND